MSSKKIAAATSYLVEAEVLVRIYNHARDKAMVEELERLCEVGQPGKPALVTDLMGDPIARVRNFSSHIMLVAEYGNGREREIAGVIRGCIKTVTIGKRMSIEFPVYVKMAYILGLRMSKVHRRLGIATKLVKGLEEWCRQNDAQYAYMATECGNEPCLNLFTKKCNYVKFRNPAVLVQPVHLHHKRIPSDITIAPLPQHLVEVIYRRIFSESEFFPKDIDELLDNNLSLGTYMATSKNVFLNTNPNKTGLPSSFAILSVWNTKEIFKLRMKGVSSVRHAACLGTRLLDAMFPWLKIPSIPNVFENFGFYFLYGLHMEGKEGPRLMKNLCKFAHNMARHDGDCKLVVAEVGQMDPVRMAVPHWRKFSWDEDIWCIKKLEEEDKKNSIRDDDHLFNKSSLSKTNIIFVDPRDL